jgi:hypothetical protein
MSPATEAEMFPCSNSLSTNTYICIAVKHYSGRNNFSTSKVIDWGKLHLEQQKLCSQVTVQMKSTYPAQKLIYISVICKCSFVYVGPTLLLYDKLLWVRKKTGEGTGDEGGAPPPW